VRWGGHMVGQFYQDGQSLAAMLTEV
jgi:hypothetical protein